MRAEFEDFCLWMYVIVDELWRQVPASYKRTRGPVPGCSDSELITLALVGECRGWRTEAVLLSEWAASPALFPVRPERRRFNRRRRDLAPALNTIRQAALAIRDVAADRQCAVDSLPVPARRFHLVPGATGAATRRAAGADFGKVPTKKQTIFGDELQLLVTLGGVIRDFVLAPASASAVAVGAELLREHAALVVIGDKGYSSAPLAQELRDEQAVVLLTVPRCNQRRQLPAEAARAQPPAPDHRDGQWAVDRAVGDRAPSCPYLPGPLRPAPYQAGRAHALPRAQSARGAGRLAPDQGARLPNKLAQGPKPKRR